MPRNALLISRDALLPLAVKQNVKASQQFQSKRAGVNRLTSNLSTSDGSIGLRPKQIEVILTARSAVRKAQLWFLALALFLDQCVSFR